MSTTSSSPVLVRVGIGVVLALGGVVVMIKLMQLWSPASPVTEDRAVIADSSDRGDVSSVTIPVQYLPKFEVQTDEEGNHVRVTTLGTDSFTVPADELALILVDTWGFPDEPDTPDAMTRRRMDILEKSRQHGVTVIHAPNQPVVDKYAQYHELRETVAEHMTQYDSPQSNLPPFMDWPPPMNETWVKSRKIRHQGRKPWLQVRPRGQRDISKFLRPLEDEYVVASQEEFRYVLWKNGITVLLYIGGALNECMQHRETGINILAGVDNQRVPFTIVVLEDCSSATPTPGADAEANTKAMLDYLRLKLAFTANSKELQFNEPEG